jgi:hypothetical protein
VRSTVLLRNVVGETENALLVGIVPLHRHLDRNILFFAAAVEDGRVEHRLRAIHIFDKGPHTSGEREALVFSRALVDQHDPHAVIEKRQFAQAPSEDVVVVIHHAEDLP